VKSLSHHFSVIRVDTVTVVFSLVPEFKIKESVTR